MRAVNEMFHIDGERLVKTSNGQPIPDDEPVFILRGRDAVAADAIEYYSSLCHVAGTPQDRTDALDAVARRFRAYHIKKIPGSTHGA